MSRPRRQRPAPAPVPAQPSPAQPGFATWLPYLGLAIGLAIVLGVVVVLNRTPAPRAQPPPAAAAPPGQEQVPVETGTHIPNGARGHWASDPPASGEHYPAPAPWGFTDQRLPPETWVHNLEHGGVAVLYSCPGGCPADVAAIRAFIQGAPPDPMFGEVKLVDAPYPVPGHRFALVAWGWRLFLDSWDPEAARAFYLQHVNRGPEVLP